MSEQANLTQDELDIEIQQTKEKIENMEQAVKLRDSLIKLHEISEFKTVFENAYFKDEADRLFKLLTEPTHLKRDQLENIGDKLSAIRILKLFFVVVDQNGIYAESSLDEERKYLQDLINGKDSEDSIIDTEVEE